MIMIGRWRKKADIAYDNEDVGRYLYFRTHNNHSDGRFCS